jgi:hypothetical protein
VVAILREADRDSVAVVAKRHAVSEQTRAELMRRLAIPRDKGVTGAPLVPQMASPIYRCSKCRSPVSSPFRPSAKRRRTCH